MFKRNKNDDVYVSDVCNPNPNPLVGARVLDSVILATITRLTVDSVLNVTSVVYL